MDPIHDVLDPHRVDNAERALVIEAALESDGIRHPPRVPHELDQQLPL